MGRRTSIEYHGDHSNTVRILRQHGGTVTNETSFAITNAYSSSTQLLWSAISAVTNANGNTVRFGHDMYGRMNVIVPPVGPCISLSNNVLGFRNRVSPLGSK
jgi:hypothetical protein